MPKFLSDWQTLWASNSLSLLTPFDSKMLCFLTRPCGLTQNLTSNHPQNLEIRLLLPLSRWMKQEVLSVLLQESSKTDPPLDYVEVLHFPKFHSCPLNFSWALLIILLVFIWSYLSVTIKMLFSFCFYSHFSKGGSNNHISYRTSPNLSHFPAKQEITDAFSGFT